MSVSGSDPLILFKRQTSRFPGVDAAAEVQHIGEAAPLQQAGDHRRTKSTATLHNQRQVARQFEQMIQHAAHREMMRAGDMALGVFVRATHVQQVGRSLFQHARGFCWGNLPDDRAVAREDVRWEVARNIVYADGAQFREDMRQVAFLGDQIGGCGVIDIPAGPGAKAVLPGGNVDCAREVPCCKCFRMAGVDHQEIIDESSSSAAMSIFPSSPAIDSHILLARCNR